MVVKSCCQTNCTAKDNLLDNIDGEDSEVDIDDVVDRARQDSRQKSPAPPYSLGVSKSIGSDDDSGASDITGKRSPVVQDQGREEVSVPTGATPGPCVDGPAQVEPGYKYRVIVWLCVMRGPRKGTAQWHRLAT